MTENKSNYSHEEHLHRFACWTAARAAQRGWAGGTTLVITEALTRVQFQENLRKLFESEPNTGEFDAWHETQVKKIGEALEELKLQPAGITYGRIAKVIAIYLKTVYVSTEPNSALARVAHPPVDSVLLRNVKTWAKRESMEIRYPIKLGYQWSKFCKLRYLNAIDYLRKINGNMAFWEIEVLWEPTQPNSKKNYVDSGAGLTP